MSAAEQALPVLYRDEYCIIVDKPAGLASHRGWSDDDDALLQRVRDQTGQWVYLVHRLDRGASGCVLLAFDPQTARFFSENWASDSVEKRYLAITRGHPPQHVLLDHPIPKAPGEARVDAVTEIRCRETFGRYAVVAASPKTGRLHQIRRHLKHLSCPLIGDVRYGKGEHNRIFREQHGLHRLALHATSLTVPHPSGAVISVESLMPEDMSNAISSCRAMYAVDALVIVESP
jgi:tRNA pseudouridine65 synthase